MPLLKGCSPETYQANIQQLVDEGYHAKQAVAIAIDTYRRNCGDFLFVQGWASPADFRRVLPNRILQSAQAARKGVMFVGSRGEPKLAPVRGKGSAERNLGGFMVVLLKGDLDQLTEKLGRFWKPSFIEILDNKGTRLMATVLQPTAKSQASHQDEHLARFKENLREFWSY